MMVAAKRYSKHVLVRGAVLAAVAAAVVAMAGLPAQAQVYYYTTPTYYSAPVYQAPVYQTSCSSVNLLIFSYSNCPSPSYVYSPAPGYYPSYWNSYYPYYQTNPGYTRTIYYYGP